MKQITQIFLEGESPTLIKLVSILCKYAASKQKLF